MSPARDSAAASAATGAPPPIAPTAGAGAATGPSPPRARGRAIRRARHLLLVLCGALTLALLAVLFHWRQVFFAVNLHPVIPGEVWRSAQPGPGDLAAWRQQFGLASVLCLRGADDDEDWWRAEAAAAAELGLDLRAVALDAKAMASPGELAEVLAHLRDAPRPLLLHCMSGVDRSGLGGALALLQEGAGLAAARGQYDLRFGYTPLLSDTRHVQVLDQYEAWLAARGLEPAPSHLGSFLHDGYVADFYAAELALVTWPQPLVAGRGGELVFEVTNTSPQVIAFRATPEAGIHARLDLAALDGAPPRRRHKLRAAEEDLDLAPGKSARFAVELPPFPAPGRYGLRLALVDEDVAWFRDMGSPDLVTHLDVAPAE